MRVCFEKAAAASWSGSVLPLFTPLTRPSNVLEKFPLFQASLSCYDLCCGLWNLMLGRQSPLFSISTSSSQQKPGKLKILIEKSWFIISCACALDIYHSIAALFNKNEEIYCIFMYINKTRSAITDVDVWTNSRNFFFYLNFIVILCSFIIELQSLRWCGISLLIFKFYLQEKSLKF